MTFIPNYTIVRKKLCLYEKRFEYYEGKTLECHDNNIKILEKVGKKTIIILTIIVIIIIIIISCNMRENGIL